MQKHHKYIIKAVHKSYNRFKIHKIERIPDRNQIRTGFANQINWFNEKIRFKRMNHSPTFMSGMLFQRITPPIWVVFSLKAIIWQYRAWVNFCYTFIVHSKCSIRILCPFMEYIQSFPFCVPQKIERHVGLEEFVIYDHKIRRCETNVTVESNGRLNTGHRCCNSNSAHKPRTHAAFSFWGWGLFPFHESFISILLFCLYEDIMNPAGLTMLRKNCFHFNGPVLCQHDLLLLHFQTEVKCLYILCLVVTSCNIWVFQSWLIQTVTLVMLWTT